LPSPSPSTAGLFNIGGEGQAYVAGLGVALPILWLDQIMPWYVFPAAIMPVRPATGAAWAFMPGWLQAKRGSHVVITTIMFNFIASSLMVYLLVNVLKPARLDGPANPHLRGWRAIAAARLASVRPFGLRYRRRAVQPVASFSRLIACVSGLGADLAHPARLRDPHHGPQPPPARLCRHPRKAASSSSP
jgi:hypothetical protein